MRRATFAAVVATAATLLLAPAASAIDKVNTTKLRNGVTVGGIMEHQRAFQNIATANGGNRAATTSGYDASVEYVSERLEAAGYDVSLDEFDFPTWEQNGEATLAEVSPTARSWVDGTDFLVSQFSASGNLMGEEIVPTNDIVFPAPGGPGSSTSGCEAGDFPASTAGNVALMQRGTCPFVQKYQNAKTAGAVAALIFNDGFEGRTAPLFITAPVNIGIPTIMTSSDVGRTLFADDAQAGGALVNIVVDATTTPNTEVNVIADTTAGNPDRTIVVGGHLDSVEAGPGINDNGSGSSSILELAEQVAKLPAEPRNRIRFAFWGAEEAGLVGSTAYVQGLSAEDREEIEANLNFDMVASPNFVRFVYDGNNDGGVGGAVGPPGSAEIEQVFLRYFASQGLATDPTAFDGRSDYGPFIAAGVDIPAGGLFTGAEGIKTQRQEDIYGGTAGLAFDPCYHQACDTIFNLSHTALDQMSDAVAHAAWTLARSQSSLTTASAARKAKRGAKRSTRMAYRGPFRVR